MSETPLAITLGIICTGACLALALVWLAALAWLLAKLASGRPVRRLKALCCIGLLLFIGWVLFIPPPDIHSNPTRWHPFKIFMSK